MKLITIGAFCLFADAAFGTDSSVPFIQADQVHAPGITGRGVTVAVIDGGIDYGDHELIGSIAGGISIIGGEYINDGAQSRWCVAAAALCGGPER